MSVISAVEHLKKYGVDDRIITFDKSGGTVSEVAKFLNTDEKSIAKTLSFYVDDRPILIVMAGDRRIYAGAFKREFGSKPKMIPRDEVIDAVGHIPGGVCPFGVNKNVEVFLDKSLKDLDFLYPACGDVNNTIKLTLKELEDYSNYIKYIDVTK